MRPRTTLTISRSRIADSEHDSDEPERAGRELIEEAALLSELPAEATPTIPMQPGADNPRMRSGHVGAIVLLGGAQAMILVAGLVRWKIIALFLGTSGVAIAGVIDNVAQLGVQLGALNIPIAALRFLAITDEQSGATGFAWLYRTFLRVLLTGTAVASVAIAVLFLAYPHVLGAGMGAYKYAVLFALAGVPMTAATNLTRNVLATIGRHGAVALALLASSLLVAAGTVLGLRVGGLGGAYAAALVVGVATVAMLHGLIGPRLRIAPARRAGSLVGLLKAHPDIVRFSITLYAVGFAVPLGYAVVRWIVLGRLGQSEAGFLAAAFTVSTGFRTVFSQASRQHLIPLTSRNVLTSTRAAEVAMYIRTLLLLMLAGALPLELFQRELILALYSRAFSPAIGILGIFILSEVIMAVGDAYRVLQLGFNDLAGFFLTTCGGTIVVVGGIWWVVPNYGLRGAALLHVFAAVVVLAWSIERLRSRHGIPVDRRSLLLTGYVIVTLAIAGILGRAVPQSTPGWIAAKAAVGALLFLIGGAMLPSAERAAGLRSLRR